MTKSNNERISELWSECDNIQTCEDLVAFVDRLKEAVSDKVFDEYIVRSYLDGIATVLFSMDEDAPEQPDWKLFGTVLLKAFFR
jgi:hypothetical protein